MKKERKKIFVHKEFCLTKESVVAHVKNKVGMYTFLMGLYKKYGDKGGSSIYRMSKSRSFERNLIGVISEFVYEKKDIIKAFL